MRKYADNCGQAVARATPLTLRYVLMQFEVFLSTNNADYFTIKFWEIRTLEHMFNFRRIKSVVMNLTHPSRVLVHRCVPTFCRFKNAGLSHKRKEVSGRVAGPPRGAEGSQLAELSDETHFPGHRRRDPGPFVFVETPKKGVQSLGGGGH